MSKTIIWSTVTYTVDRPGQVPHQQANRALVALAGRRFKPWRQK